MTLFFNGNGIILQWRWDYSSMAMRLFFNDSRLFFNGYEIIQWLWDYSSMAMRLFINGYEIIHQWLWDYSSIAMRSCKNTNMRHLPSQAHMCPHGWNKTDAFFVRAHNTLLNLQHAHTIVEWNTYYSYFVNTSTVKYLMDDHCASVEVTVCSCFVTK